ncbi:hypothetical protein [Chitinimonas sp.]|uniref:hypothetical protein n=1 Tax=Chitinimonas sp. TaxID=1934313 RepID=UPI0035B17E4E
MTSPEYSTQREQVQRIDQLCAEIDEAIAAAKEALRRSRCFLAETDERVQANAPIPLDAG